MIPVRDNQPSGAIAGVLGAYVFVYSRARVRAHRGGAGLWGRTNPRR